MENLGILIFKSLFLGLASLRKAKQEISYSISLSLIITDSEVVLREFLSPTDLTKAQTFCIHELTEVVMVNLDKNLILAAFQVVLPCFEDFNNI